MKKLYFLLVSLCLFSICSAQLTVNGFANNPTVCSGNSTLITATASPVGYSISTIPTSLLGISYTNVLADAINSNFTPRSAGINYNDCRWDAISIPFGFTYYGSPVSTVNISSNGWINFSATSATTGFGFALPAAGQPNNAIHGITANLTLDASGVLEYYEYGSAPNRRFVIRYDNVPFASGGGTATYEIHLLETSNIIEIHTESCTNTTLAKAQGVENAAGTVATTPAGRNNTTNWTATGYTNSYRFTPDVINYTWSPSATLSSSTGSSVTATPTITTIYTINAVNATNGATGSTTVTVTVDPASFTLAGTPGGATVCQNVSVNAGGSNYRDGNCNLIANVTPAGASPVTNSINTCTKVDLNATKRGTSDLYASRKYDIEPLINPATATANIKLYFLQSEFNNFNTRATDSGHKALPTGPADATGISNILLRQFHGTGTNPTNYTGFYVDFTTATVPGFTVNWNATQNWWEIIVPVDGFSGFYLSTQKTAVLAIKLNYFKGVQINNKHQLSWKVNCTSAQAEFELERSSDGTNYFAINSFTASKLRCESAFDFTDENPVAGKNYYRLKIIDIDGKVDYSNIVVLTKKSSHFDLVSLYPNIVTSQTAILKINAVVREMVTVVLSDFSGRFIQNQPVALQTGLNQIPIQAIGLPAGIYHVTIYSNNNKPVSLKLIKQ